MAKVSVVVPVYNVEPYIERCLHSLFAQTLDDIEYIFVDDCSPDKSCELIHRVLGQYPHRTQQVRIIKHECNQGLATARTDGILAATGQYIIYCDPDDYTETDMYGLMYDAAAETGADIVVCDHFTEYGTRVSESRTAVYSTPQECLLHWYDRGPDYSTLWDKLIRRDLFVRNGILPYPGIDLGEDFCCTVRLFYYARSIVRVPEALYHYCRRDESMTMRKMDAETFGKRLELVRKVSLFFQDKGFDDFCNNMKFNAKLEGRHLFENNEAQWFGIFPECHARIMSYRGNSLKSRLIWYLALRNATVYALMKKIVTSLR